MNLDRLIDHARARYEGHAEGSWWPLHCDGGIYLVCHKWVGRELMFDFQPIRNAGRSFEGGWIYRGLTQSRQSVDRQVLG